MNRIYSLIVAALLMIVPPALAQELTIKGKVTSAEDGLPVIGATIQVEGTNKATASDIDGNFLVQANKGATISISFVGFETQYITVENDKPLNIVLNLSVVQLENVVVTALGIKRSEKALGYSVQKVAGDDISKVKGVDVATSLTGKVSGLLVKNSSDFGAIPDVTIRGEKPLLVIDGIAYANKSLSDIASEDIESMSVLKGATASALYGFRGASGAILITTKNGSSNSKGVTVELSTNTMFTAGFLALPEKQAIYGRGTNNTYNRNSDSSWGPKMEGQTLTQWDPFAKEYRDYAYNAVGADNFKNFLVQGYITNNNLNVSYNKDNASLRSSLNWTQNSGQYPNQVMDKFTYTLGGDINLEKFKLSSNVSYSKKSTPNLGTNGYTSYDPMYALLIWSAADFNILDYKDNYWIKPGETQNYTYQSGLNNPYFDAYEKTIESNRDIFNADVSASYEFSKWLKVTARSGLDFFLDKGVIRVARGSYTSTGNTPIPGNQWTWFGGTTGGYAVGQTQGLSMNSDLLFTGDGAFGDFTVDYLAGGTIFYQKNSTLYAATDGGISSPGFYSLAASVNKPNASQTVWGQQVNSLYARLALSWKRMLFVEATGRNDWSSTQAGTDSPSYFYPSIAGSFIVSELLPSTKDWLDMLKVRGSWTMSKTPAAVYDTNIAFSVYNATWGNYNGASAPNYLYSPDVFPAAANTFEVGLQSNMFKNRLMVDVSYYDKKMYDFLIRGSISEASGYASKLINTQEIISRRGWEVSLRGSVIQTPDWRLDLGANWSTFSRHYVQLDPVYTPVKPWIYEGARVDAYVSKDFQYDPQGNIIWTNGRIIPSTFDSVFGYSDPDWLWGANATLGWKNFTLYASFDGVVGGQASTRTESYMWQAGVHPLSATDARLKPFVGEGVKVVSGSATYDAFGNITSDTRVFAKNDVATTYQQYVTDYHGSSAWGGNGTRPDVFSKTFFKLRELSLTYDFPRKLISPYKLNRASVSLIGQNVFLWAKDFKYSDPDGGVDDFADPAVRYLGFSVKLTF